MEKLEKTLYEYLTDDQMPFTVAETISRLTGINEDEILEGIEEIQDFDVKRIMDIYVMEGKSKESVQLFPCVDVYASENGADMEVLNRLKYVIGATIHVESPLLEHLEYESNVLSAIWYELMAYGLTEFEREQCPKYQEL